MKTILISIIRLRTILISIIRLRTLVHEIAIVIRRCFNDQIRKLSISKYWYTTEHQNRMLYRRWLLCHTEMLSHIFRKLLLFSTSCNRLIKYFCHIFFAFDRTLSLYTRELYCYFETLQWNLAFYTLNMLDSQQTRM